MKTNIETLEKLKDRFSSAKDTDEKSFSLVLHKYTNDNTPPLSIPDVKIKKNELVNYTPADYPHPAGNLPPISKFMLTPFPNKAKYQYGLHANKSGRFYIQPTIETSKESPYFDVSELYQKYNPWGGKNTRSQRKRKTKRSSKKSKKTRRNNRKR